MNKNEITQSMVKDTISRAFLVRKERSSSLDYHPLDINNIADKDGLIKYLLVNCCPVTEYDKLLNPEKYGLDDVIEAFYAMAKSDRIGPRAYGSNIGYIGRGIVLSKIENGNGGLWLEAEGEWTHYHVNLIEFTILTTLLNLTTIKFSEGFSPV